MLLVRAARPILQVHAQGTRSFPSCLGPTLPRQTLPSPFSAILKPNFSNSRQLCTMPPKSSSNGNGSTRTSRRLSAKETETAPEVSVKPSPAKRASTSKPKRQAAASVEGLAESELSEQSEAEEAQAAKKSSKAKAEAKGAGKGPKAKRAKVDDAETKPAPAHPSAPHTDKDQAEVSAPDHLPRNTAFPDPLKLEPKKAEGTSRISCFNIVSFKSALPKGLVTYLEQEDADVVVLSETKVNEIPTWNPLTKLYPHQSWSISDKKGYAGVALFSKTKPISVTKGLAKADEAGAAAGSGEVEESSRGRVLTAEFETCFVVGTYVVNAGEGLKFMDTKKRFNDALARHIAQLDSKKPVIWCGDLNVVGDWRDLSKPKDKWNKAPGYTEIECEWYRKFKAGEATQGAQPFVDMWRESHPDAIGHFSFSGHRGQQRSKGLGWRLDSFIVSKRLAPRVEACEIRHECYGISDHVPVYADLKGSL